MTPPRLDEGSLEQARKILSRLCDNGLLSMSIPVRENDEDMVLSAVIEYAAAALSTGRLGGEWLPISQAPVGREMFMARAFDVEIGKGQRYTSDPYCVWQETAGTFVRWPHKSIPPTHFMHIPPAPAAKPQGDKP
jgi:hypothetical protein